MPDLAVRVANMNPEERSAMIQRAADALVDHQCIVLPTDTLYGLMTRADDQGSALLDQITGHPEIDTSSALPEPRMTLHLADLDQVMEHLVLGPATMRRLIDRLLPGPSRLIIEQPEVQISALCAVLGISRGVIDNGTHIALRIPDHPLCRQILRAAKVPCVARRLGAALWSIGDQPGTDLSGVPQNWSSDDCQTPVPVMILDDGSTLHQQGSTTVTLSQSGKIEVSDYGVLSQREVLSNLERTVLFVCTGNTCRSPMAEAIARDMLSKQSHEGITTHVASAGVAAGNGMPATKEALDALTTMRITLSDHQSRQLTLSMIDQAEVVYTMTPSHAQAIMTMAPNSVHKVFVLDEQESVPDPIGQSAQMYQHTADRLRELIARRLEEITV